MCSTVWERDCRKSLQGFSRDRSISKYETRLHELARHAAVIMLIENKQVRRFVRGLALPLPLAIE